MAGAGQTHFWTGAVDRSFSNASNWRLADFTIPSSPPGAADDVVISTSANNPRIDSDITVNSVHLNNVNANLSFDPNTAYTLTIDDGSLRVQGTVDLNSANSVIVLQAADALDIDTGGRVAINGNGARMRLTADSSATGHDIDGELELSVSGAVLAIENSMKFIGDGVVSGEDDASIIEIGAGHTLTNGMADTSGSGFAGRMEINGLLNAGTGEIGAFENLGRVEASGGTIRFGSNTDLSDGAAADEWRVISGATLRFDRATPGLQGNFVLAGVLDVNANIATSGHLTFNTGASITVDSTSFQYDSFDGSSACSNPADSGTGGALDPFIVNTDKSCP